VATGIGVLTLDRELRIQSWNNWLATATGLTEAAARGRLVTELAPPARAALIHEVLTEVIGHGTTRVLSPALHHCLIVCPPPRLSRHFAEMQQNVTIAPLRSDDSIVGAIITIEDVTERLSAERERAERPGHDVEATDRDLISDAGASDWRVRAAATRRLKETATHEQLAELLLSLERHHHDFSVLSGALGVLIAVNRDVAGPIIQLLSDSSPNLRMHAALALGNVGGEDAVAALIGALDDDDSNVRFHVIESLGRLAVADAVGPLTRVATCGDFFLAFPAIDALGRIDDPQVLPVLVSLLDDELLRPAIVDALSAIGDEDAIPPLVALLNNGLGDVAAIATAISRIAARYESTLGDGAQIVDLTQASLTPAGIARIGEAVQKRLPPLSGPVVVAGWLGVQSLPILLSLLDRPDVHRDMSAAILGMGHEAVRPLVTVVTTGPRDASIAAAGLLGQLGDRSATPALVDTLSSHDSELVVAAVGALAAIGDPLSLDALVSLFAHPDVMVRQGALAAVQAIGDQRVEAHVATALASDDSRVRECGVRVAGYFGFKELTHNVVSALADPIEEVRRAAIEQLPMLEGVQSVDLLAAALRTESGRNRAAAAHALRSMPSANVEASLIAALRDADPWVRYFAAGSLEIHGTAACVPDLIDLARGDRAAHVRIAALAALGTVAPAAVSDLAPAMVEDADENVAAAAVSALAHVNDTHADALLERVIRGPSGVMRLAATDVLTRRATLHAVTALEWAAQLLEPPGLDTLALDGLRRIADAHDSSARPAAIAALIALGTDSSRRQHVVAAVGSLSPEAIPLLREALPASAPNGRVLLIEALARMRDPRASQLIGSALSDNVPAVRSAAIAALGRLGSSIARQTIAAMSTSDSSLAVRRIAAAVCRRYGWTDLRPDDR
jgi:HEAT repeat protein